MIDLAVQTLEQVGDGFGDPALAQTVTEAIPFLHFAIEDTTSPDNKRRMPTDDPDNWLAGPNCGSASRSLSTFLRRRQYDSRVLVNHYANISRDGHALVSVDLNGRDVWIDPTATQMLLNHGVNSDFAFSNAELVLPSERLLIFDSEDYGAVAEWLTSVIGIYRQTELAELYKMGLRDISPGYGKRKSSDQIDTSLRKIYDPSLYETHDIDEYYIDYEDMFDRWSSRRALRDI